MERSGQYADCGSGIMSGGSEINFDLGYAVNVDSNLSLLRTAYAHAQATGQAGPDAAHKLSYVFVSSLAVYGGPKCKPTDRVVPDDTPVVPGTSYGIEKSIVELYVYDYGRRGWLDAKSVRLPTVCIRSGAVRYLSLIHDTSQWIGELMQ